MHANTNCRKTFRIRTYADAVPSTSSGQAPSSAEGSALLFGLIPLIRVHPRNRRLMPDGESNSESDTIIQNKANFAKGQMNISGFSTKDYENKAAFGVRRNKPKQSQFPAPIWFESGKNKKKSGLSLVEWAQHEVSLLLTLEQAITDDWFVVVSVRGFPGILAGQFGGGRFALPAGSASPVLLVNYVAGRAMAKRPEYPGKIWMDFPLRIW